MTDTATPHRSTRLALAALAAIMFLGILVRVWGMAGESIWWDEFVSVVDLDPAQAWKDSPDYERWRQVVKHEDTLDLLTFLQRARRDDPATMPLYSTLEYLMNRHVTRSWTGLRCISLCLGCAAIPLLYLFGLRLYGPGAGLLAAMCLALSPIHRQFSLDIRAYSLMTFLALASAYSFMQVVRDGRQRWWAVHIASNLLLTWTHPFASLLPFVEGLFLVTHYLYPIRRAALWTAAHVAIAIPIAMYVSTIHFWSAEHTSEWQKIPTKAEFMGDLIGDDCIALRYDANALGLTPQYRGAMQMWDRVAPSGVARSITDAAPAVAKGMMAACVLAALWLGLWSAQKNAASNHAGWCWWAFLMAWWLLPAIILYVASHEWRPCSMPRYTGPSSLALYLMIGGAVASVPRRAARAVLACAFIGLYGYQAMFVLHGPQHTDWLGASRHIRAEARPEDPILVADSVDGVSERMLMFNMGPVPNPVSYTTAFDVLAEACAFWVDLSLPSQAKLATPRQAWAVIATPYFDSGPIPAFELELAKRGLGFEASEFGGVEHVMVYRVRRKGPEPAPGTVAVGKTAPKEFGDLAMEFWKKQDYDSAVAASRRAIAMDPQYPRAYTYLGMALKERGDKDEALDAFRHAIRLAPDDYLWTHTNIGTLLAEKGQYDDAIAAFQRAIAMDKNYAFAYMGLGKAYAGKGDFDAALAALKKSIELDPNDVRARDALRDVEAAKPPGAPQPAKAAPAAETPAPAAQTPVPAKQPEDVAALCAQGEALIAQGQYDAAVAVLSKALEQHPDDTNACAQMGIALLGKGDDAGALASFRKVIRADAQAAQLLGPLLDAIFESKDYDKAWAEMKRLTEAGVEFPPLLRQKLERDSGRTQ